MSNNNATDDLVGDFIVNPLNGLGDIARDVSKEIMPTGSPVNPLDQGNEFVPQSQEEIARASAVRRNRARTLDSFRIPSQRSETGLSTPGRAG